MTTRSVIAAGLDRVSGSLKGASSDSCLFEAQGHGSAAEAGFQGCEHRFIHGEFCIHFGLRPYDTG